MTLQFGNWFALVLASLFLEFHELVSWLLSCVIHNAHVNLIFGICKAACYWLLHYVVHVT